MPTVIAATYGSFSTAKHPPNVVVPFVPFAPSIRLSSGIFDNQSQAAAHTASAPYSGKSIFQLPSIVAVI